MIAAGYVENWKFHNTYSGVAQGNISAPILANIYLHELDLFMDSMHADFSRGKRRAENNEYRRTSKSIRRCRLQIDNLKQKENSDDQIKIIKKQIKFLEEKRRTMSAGRPFDENYKRLFYCRYADDCAPCEVGRMKIFLINKLHRR